ncbi:MAG TPA: DUF4010 domain-containing protein [Bacteroidales bacterium]|nr:DUF4010 domain-containing protein [Bacteroidales bacterium]
MREFLFTIPKELVDFFLITVFSLIIGLSQRRFHLLASEAKKLFGTDRTFTFIGILGYILYIIDNGSFLYFLIGGIIISVFLAIYYFFKIKETKDFGLTTILIALITYCLTPLLITQPFWLFLLIVVTVLIFTELKDSFIAFSSKFDKDEFLILGKFLVIAGVILPIVPDERVISYLSITPYKVWLTVVVISTISYLSYLLKKFVFKQSGILLTGILGGLYSSTAATVILARKSKEAEWQVNQYTAAMIIATAMMYVRILLLAAIFYMSLFRILLPWLFILFGVSVVLGIFIFCKKQYTYSKQTTINIDKNPLEFKTALIFTLLFVSLTFIIYYSIERFGIRGLNILSFLVGVTDIDPFILNIFQGNYNLNMPILAAVSMQAIISNNIMKVIYGCMLGNKKVRKLLIISFIIITFINSIALIFI